MKTKIPVVYCSTCGRQMVVAETLKYNMDTGKPVLWRMSCQTGFLGMIYSFFSPLLGHNDIAVYSSGYKYPLVTRSE